MTYDDDERMIEDEDDGYSDVFEDEPEPLFNFPKFKRKRKAPREEYEEEYEEPRRGYEEPRRREEPRSNINYDSRRGYSEPVRPAQGLKPDVSMHFPQSYEEVKSIAASLRAGHTVLLNLERASSDEQRRIMDFMAGVIFATDGQCHRFSSSTYVFAPAGVRIEGISIETGSSSAEESTGVYI